MEDTSGFYKLNEDGAWIHAPNFVYGPGFELLREEHQNYIYPVDGWEWFDQAPVEYVEYLSRMAEEN